MDTYATAVDRSLPDRALPVRFKEPPPIPSHSSFHRKRPTLSTLDVVIEAPRAEEISALSPPRRGSRSSARDGSSDESPGVQQSRQTVRRKAQGDDTPSAPTFFNLMGFKDVAAKRGPTKVESEGPKLWPLWPKPLQPLRRSHSTSSAEILPQRPIYRQPSESTIEEYSRRRSIAYLTGLEADLQDELDALERRDPVARQRRQHNRSRSVIESRLVGPPPTLLNDPINGHGQTPGDDQSDGASVPSRSTGLRRTKSTMEPPPTAIPPYSSWTRPTGPATTPVRETSPPWTMPWPRDHDDVQHKMQRWTSKTAATKRPSMFGGCISGGSGNEP